MAGTRTISVCVLLAVCFALWAMLSSAAWEPNGHVVERHPEATWLFETFQPEDARSCYVAEDQDRRVFIFDLPGQDPCNPNRLVGIIFTTLALVVVTGFITTARKAAKILHRDNYQ